MTKELAQLFACDLFAWLLLFVSEELVETGYRLGGAFLGLDLLVVVFIEALSLWEVIVATTQFEHPITIDA